MNSLETDPFGVEMDELDDEFEVVEDEEDPNVFRVRDPLIAPRSVKYTLYDLFRALNDY